MITRLRPGSVAHLGTYDLFDLMSCAQNVQSDADKLYGKGSFVAEHAKEIASLAESEIRKRNEWGRYVLYSNNPWAFQRRRVA